jgi:hypothetical protein
MTNGQKLFSGYFQSTTKTVKISSDVNRNPMRTQANILPLIMISGPSNELSFRLFPLRGSRKTTSQDLEHETVLKTLINRESINEKNKVIRFITNNQKILTQIKAKDEKVNVKIEFSLNVSKQKPMVVTNSKNSLFFEQMWNFKKLKIFSEGHLFNKNYCIHKIT